MTLLGSKAVTGDLEFTITDFRLPGAMEEEFSNISNKSKTDIDDVLSKRKDLTKVSPRGEILDSKETEKMKRNKNKNVNFMGEKCDVGILDMYLHEGVPEYIRSSPRWKRINRLSKDIE
jgi:hypothetical protein